VAHRSIAPDAIKKVMNVVELQQRSLGVTRPGGLGMHRRGVQPISGATTVYHLVLTVLAPQNSQIHVTTSRTKRKRIFVRETIKFRDKNSHSSHK
jgi:hypothetical protein